MQLSRAEKISGKLDSLIEKYMKMKVFSACSVGYFTYENSSTRSKIFTYGFNDCESKYPVSTTTVYDLASLTKPLVTALCLFQLIDTGKLDFEDTLDKFFPQTPIDKSNINILQLLNHSSGLADHHNYWQNLNLNPDSEKSKKIITWILEAELQYEPGTDHIYSDLGYLLLGYIIECITGKNLSAFWKETVVLPLELEKHLFFAENKGFDISRCAETGRCSWSKDRLCGVVHDDNCRALGGVAGHAGLFGTVYGVLGLCEFILKQHQQGGWPNIPKRVDTDVLINPGSWFYGFDTPTKHFSSSGKYFSEQTIGHLGFTGTSFWLDLQKGVAVVLLTNRVLFNDNSANIKRFRPQVHDIIWEGLSKKVTSD